MTILPAIASLLAAIAPSPSVDLQSSFTFNPFGNPPCEVTWHCPEDLNQPCTQWWVGKNGALYIVQENSPRLSEFWQQSDCAGSGPLT